MHNNTDVMGQPLSFLLEIAISGEIICSEDVLELNTYFIFESDLK